MPRITVDLDLFTYQYLVGLKDQRGSSISFEANVLIQQAIKERNRKKKTVPLGGESEKNIQVPDNPPVGDQGKSG